MTRKLNGAKRRNLTKRGGVIYYQRVVNGKRVRFSCETGDWGAAASVLRCSNGSCTRTWDGQQVSPTDCEHRRRAPWEGISGASAPGSVRDAGPRERRRV